jgi:hypothetical protein
MELQIASITEVSDQVKVFNWLETSVEF